MPNANERQNLTLLFEIPHISKLFIYRYHWTDSFMMRKIVAEILRSGQFELLYFGENASESYNAKREHIVNDTALICVTIRDLAVPENYSLNACKEFFIKELAFKKNFFQFDSELIDERRNTSSIKISIKVQHAAHFDIAEKAA